MKASLILKFLFPALYGDFSFHISNAPDYHF